MRDCMVDLGALGHVVACDCERPPAGRTDAPGKIVEHTFAPRQQRHPRTLTGEAERNILTDAAGGASDDDRLVAKISARGWFVGAVRRLSHGDCLLRGEWGIRAIGEKLKKCGENGAGDRSRTDDFDLGKVALYQLSYTRPATDCNF